MKKAEYMMLLEKQNASSLITVDDLADKSDRTLLYGYTCMRDTWHVYIKFGRIFTVVYCFGEDPEEVSVQENSEFVPNKRLYPERCDFEFCELLKSKDIYLPFTIWERDEPEKDCPPWHGLTM